MDKLEKAMQKARQERAMSAGLSPLASSPFAAQGSLLQSGRALPVINSKDVVTLTEEQLDRSRIVAHHTRSAEADVFRLLRTQILQIMAREKYRTLAITSADYGDGKSTIALNLAISIAMDLKQTVLLADIDLRKPNLHEFLGIEPEAGLSDYLLHDTPLPECLLRLSFERLTILPAGKPIERSSETLGLPKMAALAHEMKTRYPDRLIIYDMPPVLAQDDPLAFIPHVDAVLMVVREGKSKTADVTRCLDILSNANVIGTVLNEAF
ncbi:MAG TPA: exopolysaccharide biosynthesis protein [Rhodospirillaceae bacterium]|nr:exopolysaccharide biosynthesis protein [Rhodospirillaceae bacterium]